MIARIVESDLDGVIELVKSDDVRPFLQIEKDTPREGVKSFLFNPSNIVFVSKHLGKVNGVIVGMTKLGKRKHVVELIIAVSKPFWGLGVALDLLLVLKSELKAKGFLRVELSSYASNVRARCFYLKSGFVVEGVKRGSLLNEDGGLEDEVMFGWVL